MISAQRIWVLAANTVRAAIRNKLLYTLLFFAIALIATGVLVSTLSYVERERILQDVGLSAIRIFGAGIAIFVGVGLIHGEVDRRTIYTILSKPVSRGEFLVGKYLGLVLTMWLQLLVMALAFCSVSLLYGAPITGGHLAALLLVAFELVVLVAVATLFSSFTTPLLASLFTVGIWLVGHSTRSLRLLGEQADLEGVRVAAEVVYRAMPDLASFDLGIAAVHGLPIDAVQVLWPMLYGTLYAALLLFVAVLVFERRDFR